MKPRQPITLRKVLTYAVILLLACGNALSYHIFVFPNRFAPSGLNGLCTIVQELFGLNVGYLSLIINIPLSLMAYSSPRMVMFLIINRKKMKPIMPMIRAAQNTLSPSRTSI